MAGLTVVLLLVLVTSSSFDPSCARGGGRSSKKGGGRDSAGLQQRSYGDGATRLGKKPSMSPVMNLSLSAYTGSVPAPSKPPSSGGVFGVMQFGATGNGISDDTKAFQAAWAAACNEEGSSVLVPSGNEFLVGPITFSGSQCQPNIIFQLDGTIVAPTAGTAWEPGLLQWLKFTNLRGMTVRGRGIIDGRGSSWWGEPPHGNELVSSSRVKPTALRFYGSDGITVNGITIRNSPQCHLKFDGCTAVEVFNLTVSSPGFSVHTDGIHLQNSRNVSIHHVILGCGDDCVSIQTGCSDVEIRSVTCGPGHGISIGGLGGGNTMACVSNVTVQDVVLRGTMTGVRIKTWQGGSGRVQNIRFSNIWVTEVKIPMVIDQYYCDGGGAACRNQSSAVALAGISYEGVRGTYTASPLHLACSDSAPCAGIRLSNVQLEPAPGSGDGTRGPFCWQAHGQLTSPVVPPVGCLESEESTPDPFPASC